MSSRQQRHRHSLDREDLPQTVGRSYLATSPATAGTLLVPRWSRRVGRYDRALLERGAPERITPGLS